MPESPARPERLLLPPEGLLRAAARTILSRGNADLRANSELSCATVLLPSLRAVPDFVRALAGEAQGATFRLPKITTLREWARLTPVAGPALSDAQRELRLYDALKQQGWFAEVDLWKVARELRELADELSLQRIALAESLVDFSDRLARAYRAKAGASLRFEARVVFEMWRALSQGDAGADRIARYHLQLSALARSPCGPLYMVDSDELSPAEVEFLDAYARQSPVCLITSDRASPQASPLARALSDLWLHDSTDSLSTRAANWSRWPDPFATRLRLSPAASLEQEAEAVAHSVVNWLREGRSNIALVAQDRVVARRVRALLERAQVLVEDETGWTLSTVSAATVLMRVLDCVAGNFHYQDLLDLLKSPFVFGDWPDSVRKSMMQKIEQYGRRHSIVSGLDRYADRDSAEVRTALDRLSVIAKLFSGRTATIHDWLDRLDRALQALGVIDALRRDSAGMQLLELLNRLGAEVAGEPAKVDVSEWRQWLDSWLERELFLDQSVVSPVRITHLAATRLREFDAVAILGCDAEHFPGEQKAGLFFNEAVRSELGLPARRQHLLRQKHDLVNLLARSRTVLLSWQASRQGDAVPASPWVELLTVFHARAWGTEHPLDEVTSPRRTLLNLRTAPRLTPTQITMAAPAPSVAAHLPGRVSVSGYASLMNCPYQFFGRHVLGLGELDEVREELEKRDYGEFIHSILLTFHRTYPIVSQEEPSALIAALDQLSAQVFAQSMSKDALARSWLLRWRKIIPHYVTWQREREQQGWRFADGEVQRTAQITPGEESSLQLYGRIDRIDVRGEERSVIDYKTADRQRLRRQLAESGENVQLASYVWLQENVTEAMFVSLDRDAPSAVELPGDVNQLATGSAARLGEIFMRLRNGAGLIANGDEHSCSVCEMRGLCRKDFWI